MVTPFDDDARPRRRRGGRARPWLQAQGNEGLVVAGTTGESPTLTDDEKLQLWEAVAEAVTIPVVAGSTGNDTAHSVHLTVEASKLGVAGILALCPYYNRPSQAGIEAHLRAIAEATELPVMIYDIPIRTGRKIATDVLVRLAHEVPNIVGVKDAAGNPGETARLVAAAPDGFEVYSGDDALTLPLARRRRRRPDRRGRRTGSRRTSSSCSTPGSRRHRRRRGGSTPGCWRAARSRPATRRPNPLPAKAMLRHLGQPAGRCRPPMGADPDWLDRRAAEVYSRLVAARG